VAVAETVGEHQELHLLLAHTLLLLVVQEVVLVVVVPVLEVRLVLFQEQELFHLETLAVVVGEIVDVVVLLLVVVQQV
jgi:hypothetical protein